MKLSIDGIKDKTAWEEAGIKLPAYDVRKVAENTKASPVWVHFGIGNIFRIFIGGIADSLIEQGVSDKGITCVETFDFDVVAHSVTGVTNELTEKIEKLPIKEQKKIIKVIHTLLEE